MKQVVQNYKTGEVKLREVSVPECGAKRVLVRNYFSLVSIGTERSTIELGKKSLAGKAAARPDLVRRVWDKAKKEGLVKTWQEAMGRLDTPTPLGYSTAGEILECGNAVTEVSPGDKVACIGQGFASHAEIVSIPANLMTRIPQNVSAEQASFGMLGVIALHGIRCGNLTFGGRVVIMGLGLLGLLTLQMLRAYGCEVIGFDPDSEKVRLAKKLGFENVVNQVAELSALVETHTRSSGVDAVLITAATKKRDPVDHAIQLCRSRGKIVVVGVADIHPDRNELWQKEVELVVSRAAGPGSLDPLYEIEGVDLPIGDVRWTQKRNLEEFLRLQQKGIIDVSPLISHRFSIESAEEAYHQLLSGTLKNPIGVLLEYSQPPNILRQIRIPESSPKPRIQKDSIRTGVIGAGLFGKALLLPAIQKEKGFSLHTLVTRSGANSDHNARKFGFEIQATEESAVWESEEIEAVIGLTPHNHHASLVESSIKTGKALFLEKPLCISEEELIKLESMAASSDELPIIMVGHNRRFSPHLEQLHRWLLLRKNPLVIQYRVNSGFVPSDHWVHSEGEGRSRIVGEMTHFIDLLNSITGSSISRVHAERIGGDNQSAVNNDNIAVTFKFEEGSVANLTYAASGDKAFSREKIEIFFEGNTLVSEDFRFTKKHFGGKTETFKTAGQEMGYREELKHFISLFKGGESRTVTLKEAFQTMRVVFAIETSLSTGQAIRLS